MRMTRYSFRTGLNSLLDVGKRSETANSSIPRKQFTPLMSGSMNGSIGMFRIYQVTLLLLICFFFSSCQQQHDQKATKSDFDEERNFGHDLFFLRERDT